MNMLDTLRRTGGLSALSSRLGLTPAQSAQVADAVVPYLISGFGRVFRRLGQHGFNTQLESLGGEEMAQAVLIPGVIQPSAGEAALRLAFGSIENADRVEAAFRNAIELEAAYYRDAMRILAMLLGGYLSASIHRAELGEGDGVETLLKPGQSDELLDAVAPLND